jgi:hypothetical protein
MATNKYNRGMPIIQRTKPGDGTKEAPIEISVSRPRARVTPIAAYRQRQEQFRVRALKMRLHTFFWALAS